MVSRNKQPKGVRYGGRKKGTQNKFTRDVQEALLQAANIAGGKEGMIGYFVKLAKWEPATFGGLIKSLIPLQIKGDIGGTVQMIHSAMTPQEAMEAYASLISASRTQLIEATMNDKEKENEK